MSVLRYYGLYNLDLPRELFHRSAQEPPSGRAREYLEPPPAACCKFRQPQRILFFRANICLRSFWAHIHTTETTGESDERRRLQHRDRALHGLTAVYSGLSAELTSNELKRESIP